MSIDWDAVKRELPHLDEGSLEDLQDMVDSGVLSEEEAQGIIENARQDQREKEARDSTS